MDLSYSKSKLIEPIPENIKYDKAKALLGKKLFNDTILSKDQKISCASCHQLNQGGTIHKRFSIGAFGKIHQVNSPTVFNAIFNFRQNWNGSAKNLYEQALMALKDDSEMAITEKELEDRLNSSKLYRNAFNQLYGISKIKISYVVDAIVEFEKTLITPNSKFDLFLKNKIKLNKKELKGFNLFKNFGCITCHNGINIGGNSYQKIGVINPFKWNEKVPDLFKLTKNVNDKNILKVPTLRNIALTYPYFHDGSAATLEEAVKKMAILNLGLELSKEEIQSIIYFLKTLTGNIKIIGE